MIHITEEHLHIHLKILDLFTLTEYGRGKQTPKICQKTRIKNVKKAKI